MAQPKLLKRDSVPLQSSTNLINSGDLYNKFNSFLNDDNTLKIDLLNSLYPIGCIYTTKGNINPSTILGGKWEKVTDKLNGQQIVNTYFGVSDLVIHTESDGSKWLQLVSHNSNNGTTIYSSTAEALDCNTAGKKSDLWVLQTTHELLLNNGHYEFLLRYPQIDATAYNRWIQTSNPFSLTNTSTGYQAIHIDWSGNSWGGMGLSGEYALLDCCNHTNWWYAICPFDTYSGGNPGPGVVNPGYTNLYVRVPSIELDGTLIGNGNLISILGVEFWQRIS